MTKVSYNLLSLEEKAKHDEYMRKYFASDYYQKLKEAYSPQCNKMDKSHLAYAITDGKNLFGLDHFAWKKLKELIPELTQLKHIVKFSVNNAEIKEEARDLLAIFTS